MEHIIVESSFGTSLSPEREHEAAQNIDKELALSGGRWLRSFISPDRRRLICEFLAKGEDTVRKSYEKSGLPVEKLWTATVFSSEEASASA